jgi:predicted transcriptional regulator
MKANIKKALEELGIPLEISELYIALIHEGSAGVARLSRLVDRPKSSVMDDLRWLSKNGFVVRYKKKNAFIFTADPDYIFDEFVKRRREAEHLEQQASNLSTELKTFYNVPSKKPKIEYREGKTGVRLAYEDTVKEPNKEILGYGPVEMQYETAPKLFPDYYDMRARRKVFFRGLFPITPKTLEECWNNDEKHLRKTYFIGLDKYSPIEINVYGDTTLIVSHIELFTVTIRSRQVADSFRHILNMAIDGSKNEDKEIREKIKKQGLKKFIKEKEKEFKHGILET